MQESAARTGLEEEAKKLLQAHGEVIEKLVDLGVVKTRNNPIGDYTEWLVKTRMGFTDAPSNQKGYDATDNNGKRYQIKGRREEGSSVQFSVVRQLEHRQFDFLIAVAFNNNYSIRFAVMIPHEIVKEFANYQRHVNGYVPILRDESAKQPELIDIRHLLE